MNKIKRLQLKLACVITALVMIIAGFSGLAGTLPRAFAEEEDTGVDYYSFSSSDAGLNNGEFREFSSNSAAGSATSWSPSYLGTTTNGHVIPGVVELTSSGIGNKDRYEKLELAGLVAKSFSYPNSENTQSSTTVAKTAYMINSLTETAYAAKSNSFNMVANSHYRFSTYIYTAGYGAGGAFFKLDMSDSEDVSIGNISTGGEWQQYTIYVETGTLKAESAQISIQNGDYYIDSDNVRHSVLSKGVSFFYRVTAEQISAATYAADTAAPRANTVIKSYLNPHTSQFANSGFELGMNGWSLIEGKRVNPPTLQSPIDITDFADKKEYYGLKDNPMSPDGSNFVLAVTGKDSKQYWHGIRSSDLMLGIAKYYHIRVMVKTADGGSLTVKVSGDNIKEDTIPSASKTTTSASDKNALFGWESVSIFISSSSLKAGKINLDLYFGDPDALVTGTVYVDAILVEEITQTQFRNASNADINFSIDTNVRETGVPNGNFDSIGNYSGETVYPLPVNSWTVTKTDDSSIPTSQVKSGIVNISESNYGAHSSDFGNLSAPPMGNKNGPNNLLIYSGEPTAFGYASESISLASSTAGKFTVLIATRGGAVATLIVKRDKTVISTIENISTEAATSGYKDYELFFESNNVAHSLTIEIWLGNPDGETLSEGGVFIDRVSFGAIDASAYAEAESFGDTGFRSVFSFKSGSVFGYNHSEKSAVKTPFFWTKGGNSNSVYSTLGIYEFRDIQSVAEAAKAGFNNSGAIEGQHNAIALSCSAPSFSTATTAITETLNASSTYKVVVMAKTVGIGAGQYGGFISIRNTDATIKNIDTTADLADKADLNANTYKEFVFYLKTGTASESVGITFGLGGTKTAQQSYGTIIIGSISYNPCSPEEYSAGIKDLLSTDDDIVKPTNIAYVDYTDQSSTPTPEDPTEKEPIKWWLVPSILFGLAIIIALVGIPLKSILKKRKTRVKKLKASDRKAAQERIRQENLAKLSKLKESAPADEYDDTLSGKEYDDSSAPEKSAPTEAPAPIDAPAETDAEPAADDTASDSSEATGSDTEEFKD